MKYILAFLGIVFFVGCTNENIYTTKRVDENVSFCDIDVKSLDYYSKDPNILLRMHYPDLFVIPIVPVNTEYHAAELMKSQAREEIAYHILAIGILKKETPEVIDALNCAVVKHGDKKVPFHFDWADSAEAFKSEFKQHPDMDVVDVPGSRGINFHILIHECFRRIKE